MRREYVTDMQAVVWHLFAPERLGRAAQALLLDADAGLVKIYVPAVVLAEMIMVVERKRLKRGNLPQLFAHLETMQNNRSYELLPLLPSHVKDSHTLTAIPDIFDRLIVAETLRLGLPLITSDTVITGSGLVTVIWN